jgi:hypothetical protein
VTTVSRMASHSINKPRTLRRVRAIAPEHVLRVAAMKTNARELPVTWMPKSETSKRVRVGELIMLLATLAAVSVYARVHLSGREDDYAGGLAALDRLYNLFLATFLIGPVFWVGSTTEWRRVLAPTASMDDVNVELKGRGITHVLLASNLFYFAARMGREGLPNVSGSIKTSGPDYESQLRTLATFGSYQVRFLDQVYSDKFSYYLYQIR